MLPLTTFRMALLKTEDSFAIDFFPFRYDHSAEFQLQDPHTHSTSTLRREFVPVAGEKIGTVCWPKTEKSSEDTEEQKPKLLLVLSLVVTFVHSLLYILLSTSSSTHLRYYLESSPVARLVLFPNCSLQDTVHRPYLPTSH